MTITLDDLESMSNKERYEVVKRAHPLNLDAIADTTYTGIDLSMPSIFHKLAWKYFRKTFHRDPRTGRIRGWNVKTEQTGADAPPEAKRDAKGRPLTFGHYEIHPVEGLRFPRGWEGPFFMDYRAAGNRFLDWPARAGYCPLVAVNEGSMELLLGWEIFNVAGILIDIGDFWALKREGPLPPDEILPRPDSRG